MSTVLSLTAKRTTLAGVDHVNYDIATAVVGANLWWYFFPTTGATKVPVGDMQTTGTVTESSGSGLTYAFVSARLSAAVTIASDIAFVHQGRDYAKMNPIHATFRFELSKITTSGNVETLIGSVDEPAVASTETDGATAYTSSIPVTTPIPMVAGERFVLRAFLIPAPGQTIAGSANGIALSATNTSTNPTLTFAETFTLVSNTTRLYQRRTAVAGIGNFFDLLPTKITQTAISGVVSTTAGGTEIQWTRTPAANLLAGAVVTITDTSNVTSYVSSAFTPTANYLYLLGVVHSDTAPEATQPTITTTTGLNFINIGTVPFDTIASNVHRLTVFRAMKSSGLANGTITVNLADAGTGCAALLVEVAGCDSTGTDGANAVGNIVTGSANAAANPSITMGSYGSSSNGVMAFFATDSTVPTTGSGFGVSASTSYATPTTTLMWEFAWNTPAVADVVASAQDWGGLAVELVTAVITPTPLEWISPRLAGSWYFDQPDPTLLAAALSVAVSESSTTVNANWLLRLFRYRNGVETQFYEYHWPTEISTVMGTVTPATTTVANQTFTPTALQADDRIVMRMYVVPVDGQTMGAGTATVNYDAGAASFGTGWVDLFDLPTSGFKAESDPATPATVPDAMSTMGMQN